MKIRIKDRKKEPGKPKAAPSAGTNLRLAQQTRKHYASKYKVRPR